MPFPLQRTLDPIVEPVSLSDMKDYLRVDITEDDALISSIISVARERAEDLTSRSLYEQEWTFCMDRFPLWLGEHTYGYGLYGGCHRHLHSMFIHDRMSIILPRGPVLAVDSITYKDLTGTVQTLGSDWYEVDLISQPARITPVYNGSWPVALWDTNSITIKFRCGYQQTATEIVTVPATNPATVAVSRQTTSLFLISAVDATTLGNPTPTPVDATMNAGILTFPNPTPGQKVQVVYQVSSIPQSFIHAIKLISGAFYENRAEVIQGGGNFNVIPSPLSATSLLSTYDLFPLGYPKD